MKVYNKLTITAAINTALPKKRLELSERQISRLKTAAQIILALGAAAGAVALAVMAPNAGRLLGQVGPNRSFIQSKERRTAYKHQVLKSLYYLKQRGDIELIQQGNDYLMKITQKGRKKIQKMRLGTLAIKRPSFWKGRWWLVLADIPSKPFRSRADLFRNKLKELQFYPLQRTVWVYPFDPRDEVDFISAFYNLERFVTCMEVSKMDPSDEKLVYDFFYKSGLLKL